jgi:hypothetical protein
MVIPLSTAIPILELLQFMTFTQAPAITSPPMMFSRESPTMIDLVGPESGTTLAVGSFGEDNAKLSIF